MQFNLGSIYVNDFNILNRVYRVKAQAEGSLRSDLRDIYNLKVPNIRGNNVPLGSVAKINRIIGPSRVSRFNLYPCAEIIGALERGHSTGEAIAEIEKIASEVLPDGMGIEWTDLAFQEKRMVNTIRGWSASEPLGTSTSSGAYRAWLLRSARSCRLRTTCTATLCFQSMRG